MVFIWRDRDGKREEETGMEEEAGREGAREIQRARGGEGLHIGLYLRLRGKSLMRLSENKCDRGVKNDSAVVYSLIVALQLVQRIFETV